MKHRRHRHYHNEGYCGVTFLDHPIWHTAWGHRVAQWITAICMPPICLLCFVLAFASDLFMVWVLAVVLVLVSIGQFQYHKEQADAERFGGEPD